MTGWVRTQTIRSWVLALYALASFGMGFAHKRLEIPLTTPDLSAYALPDGTLPVLCLTPKGGDPGAPSHVHAPCQACLLTSAPGLPPVLRNTVPAPLGCVGKKLLPVADSPRLPRLVIGSLGARGPPRI